MCNAQKDTSLAEMSQNRKCYLWLQWKAQKHIKGSKENTKTSKNNKK